MGKIPSINGKPDRPGQVSSGKSTRVDRRAVRTLWPEPFVPAVRDLAVDVLADLAEAGSVAADGEHEAFGSSRSRGDSAGGIFSTVMPASASTVSNAAVYWAPATARNWS
jgi:hypothetical protein